MPVLRSWRLLCGLAWGATVPCQVWFDANTRYHHAVAGGAQAVLFGGTANGTTGLGDTAIRGVGGWIRIDAYRDPPAGPPALFHHDLALFAPSAGAAHVVLFGGVLPGGQPSHQTWLWADHRWRPAATPAGLAARSRHAMVFDHDRRLLVLFGGADAANQALDDTWLWDGTRWMQRQTSRRPARRWGHALAFDAGLGRVTLFGGTDGTSVFDDTWTFDGGDWNQVVIDPFDTPPARYHHALGFDPARGELVLCGGRDAAGLLQDTWVFDASLPGWAPDTNLPDPRAGHRVFVDTTLPTPRLCVMGGVGPAGPDRSVLYWDGQFFFDQQVPNGRNDAGMAFDEARGEVVLFGGGDGCNQTFGLYDTWIWNGVRWRELRSDPAPEGRVSGAMTWDSRRSRVVLWGGLGWSGMLADTWEFNGAVWQQRFPQSPPPPRSGASLDYDPLRQRAVLFGGSTTGTAAGVTDFQHEWDGTTWTQRIVSARPSARYRHATAFDTRRGRLVLFGGDGPGPTASAETWEWDGASWNDATPPGPGTSPPGRSGHAMAFDRQRGVVVLFGGADAAGQPVGDLWEWDGTRWLRRPAGTAPWPPARQGHRLAYDPRRGRITLFGGMDAPGAPVCTAFRDNWELGPDGGAMVFGAGCLGPSGIPALEPFGVPVVASSFRLRFASLQGPTLLFLGIDDVVWGGEPLPLDLGRFGAPECSLYQSIDLVLPVTSGSMDLAIPGDASLPGSVFFAQAACLVPQFNPLSLLTSNALRARIAAR